MDTSGAQAPDVPSVALRSVTATHRRSGGDDRVAPSAPFEENRPLRSYRPAPTIKEEGAPGRPAAMRTPVSYTAARS